MTEMKKRKRIRGNRLFSVLGQTLHVVHKEGFLRALGFSGGMFGLWALNLAWKARLVWYWRWSPLRTEAEYAACDANCLACPHQKVKPLPSDAWGKLFAFLFPGGRFCEQCSCWDWRWAELTVKNTHEGHICPRGKHPGQTPMPMPATKQSCTNCSGGKPTNGQRSGPPGRRVTAPRMAPDAMGMVEDIGITVEDGHMLPATID